MMGVSDAHGRCTMAQAKQPAPPAEINDVAAWLVKRGVAPDVVERLRAHREKHPVGGVVDHELAYLLRAVTRPATTRPALTLEQIGDIFGVTFQGADYAIKEHAKALEANTGVDWRAELPPEWGEVRKPWRDSADDRYLMALVMQRMHTEGRGPAPEKVLLAQAQRWAEEVAKIGATGSVLFYVQPGQAPYWGYMLRDRRPDDDPNLIYVPE